MRDLDDFNRRIKLNNYNGNESYIFLELRKGSNQTLVREIRTFSNISMIQLHQIIILNQLNIIN